MTSPTAETIITIEHCGSIGTEELKQHYGPHGLKGIVGKLEAQGMIKKNHSKEQGVFYTLTQGGQQFVDKTLDALHRSEPVWRGKWLTVSFSIPERHRADRDKLRRLLKRYGFGCLYGSLWIVPADTDIDTETIKKLARHGRITIMEGKAHNDTEIVKAAWNLSAIRQRYETFLGQSSKRLEDLSENKSNVQLEIKKIIFSLATIISQEPDLPAELLPTDWPKQKAIALYQKARQKLF